VSSPSLGLLQGLQAIKLSHCVSPPPQPSARASPDAKRPGITQAMMRASAPAPKTSGEGKGGNLCFWDCSPRLTYCSSAASRNAKLALQELRAPRWSTQLDSDSPPFSKSYGFPTRQMTRPALKRFSA
jgi:hypothetical protein